MENILAYLDTMKLHIFDLSQDRKKKELLDLVVDILTLIGITQPVQTQFLFKSIWTRSQGSQGCQKIRFFFLQIKLLSFCAKIAPKRHKLQKTVKIEKKCQKNLVFLEYFEYSSIWGQY